jgi:pyrroline-5-carboxylate reductase
MAEGTKIGVVGGGKMGGALIGGMISGGLFPATALTVADKDERRLGELVKTYGVNVTTDNREAIRGAAMVILSVKPQDMAEVLSGLVAQATPAMLFISIAAGIATAFIEERLGKGVRVIRVMPNMPALIGEGAAALCRGASATGADLKQTRQIFEAVGTTVEVEERLMDAVTGLSGSGPGYAFFIIEALTDAGVKTGLDHDVALKLAAQSLLGAARMCLKGEKSPAEYRSMVTSPGGTTLAGLKVFEEGKLREVLIAGVEAATRRSAELGGRK